MEDGLDAPKAAVSASLGAAAVAAGYGQYGDSMYQGASQRGVEEYIIPNLPQLVTINPSITLFQMFPNLVHIVPTGVDRAIKEVVSAACRDMRLCFGEHV